MSLKNLLTLLITTMIDKTNLFSDMFIVTFHSYGTSMALAKSSGKGVSLTCNKVEGYEPLFMCQAWMNDVGTGNTRATLFHTLGISSRTETQFVLNWYIGNLMTGTTMTCWPECRVLHIRKEFYNHA